MTNKHKPISKSEDHIWKIKISNLGPGIYGPWDDPHLAQYLNTCKTGVIQQATLYSELKDTIIVRDMTETQFAEFVSGFKKLGFDLQITDISSKQD